MTDGDQERFEDYLELEKYIEALQTDKAAHPPADLTLEQMRIYQMATFFRSAIEEDTHPRAAFVEQLRSELLNASERQETVASQSEQMLVEDESAHPKTDTTPDKNRRPTSTGTSRRVHFFARRNLIAGGAIAAASLVLGAGIERVRYASQEHAETHATSATSTDKDSGYMVGQQLAIAQNIPTTWRLVATLADLGERAIRFTSDSIIGYVIRVPTDASDYSETPEQSIIALSATCTHMGCLVQWKDSERHFYCPCHGATFDVQGILQRTGYKYALPPLPRLNTKIENGNIYVELPQPH